MADALTQTHIEKVITAAIDAEMTTRGFVRGAEKYYYTRGADEYSFDLKEVPAPGHGPTGTIRLDTHYSYGEARPTPVKLNATEEVYNPWRERIEAAFKGWKDLPEPSKFSSLHARLDKGAAHLAGGAGTDTSNTAGNVDLAASVSTIESELAQYAGGTVDGFQKNYVARLGPTFANQSICGSVLAVAAKAEADVWTEANKNVVAIAEAAVTAFEDSAYGGGDITVELTVLGMLAAAATVVATPAAAATVAAGGAVISLLKDAASLMPKEKNTPQLGGNNPGAVHDNLVEAINALSADISQEEFRSANLMWDTYNTIIGPDSSDFDLSRPTDLYEETDINQLNKTDVDTGTLKTIGNSYMPEVASALRAAAKELDIGDSVAWDRAPGIGSGYTGPWHEGNSLSNQLIDYLTVTAQECEDSGEILVIAANHLNSTDGAASAALRGHRDDIEDPPEDYGRPARDGGWINEDGKYLPQ